MVCNSFPHLPLPLSRLILAHAPTAAFTPKFLPGGEEENRAAAQPGGG